MPQRDIGTPVLLCSTIYNSRGMETASVSTERQVDKEGKKMRYNKTTLDKMTFPYFVSMITFMLYGFKSIAYKVRKDLKVYCNWRLSLFELRVSLSLTNTRCPALNQPPSALPTNLHVVLL